MEHAPSGAPRLSVVVPVHNGRDTLRLCLEALQRSTLRDFELLVVDDGSTDGSAELAESMGARVIRQAKTGPAAARNQGVAASTAPLVFFTDADVTVQPDSLAQVVAAFAAAPELAALFGSYTAHTPAPGFFSDYKNLAHHHTHQRSREQASSFWTGCGALRREVFESLGGFDESYGAACIEDIELGLRIHQAGWSIGLLKSLQVTHHKVYSFRSMMCSDVLNRAVPWTRLMLRAGGRHDDLNTTRRDAVALLAAWLMPLGLVVPPLLPPAALVFLACNGEFYRFLRQQRGRRFMLKGVGANYVFHLYSGVGFWIGVGAYLRARHQD